MYIKQIFGLIVIIIGSATVGWSVGRWQGGGTDRELLMLGIEEKKLSIQLLKTK